MKSVYIVEMKDNLSYDVIIVGAGPGGIYCAYQLIKKKPDLNILLLEKGNSLENRKCPINSNASDKCVNCKVCSIMNGFGGAGAFSDGKYVITNEFGGKLSDYINTSKSIQLMEEVDNINTSLIDKELHLYDSRDASFERECLKNDIHVLEAKIRHLGTDLNYLILSKLYKELSNKITIKFNSEVKSITNLYDKYEVTTNKHEIYYSTYCVVAAGRSGSSWVEKICDNFGIKTSASNVDIGVRVELPYDIFSHITDEVYEGKLVYRTKQYQDFVRTFCMNPRGVVVAENTNGIVTVNGHSYEDDLYKTNNTNFALLVSKHMTEPFNNSNEYGESIAKFSNMLGNGVIIQRFGDLIRGQRSTEDRLRKSFVKPTLTATPGDLSLVMPKRFLDDIIEMIYALNKIAPGTANDDTLLYGVEVKFYNMTVDVDNNLETKFKNLYIIGDGSGVTHSLAQASASGMYVANHILKKVNHEI